MKPNKIIPTLALLVLLALTAAPVLAGEIVYPSTSAGTDLRATITPTYTVVIPASMTEKQSLKAGENLIGDVKATRLNLEPNTRLTCELSGNTLTRQMSSEIIPYAAYYNNDASKNTADLALNTPVPVTVHIDQTDLAGAGAGTYTGILSFVLKIV